LDAIIPVCSLSKPSSWWENPSNNTTLLKGQLAVETDDDGKGLYLLLGDGKPVQFENSYTRLRVAKVTDDLQSAIDAIKYTTINQRIAAHNNDDTAHPFIREKIETDIEAHNTDTAAHGDIRNEVSLKAPKLNPVFSGVVDMKGAVAEAAQPRSYRDEEDRPYPYGNPYQPSTVLDFLDLYNFTMESSGAYIVLADNIFEASEPGLSGPERTLGLLAYTRRLDRDLSAGDRFFDDIRKFDKSPCATMGGLERANGRIDRLDGLVMSLAGKRLRVVDGRAKDGGEYKRGIDGIGGREEYRETDIPRDDFGRIDWIPA
jgi:hypothetical protein